MLDRVQRSKIALPGRGVEIAVLDWGGDGPPALLHHANGFCAALWDGVAEGLRDRFRLLAIDARGHGDSSCPEGRDAYGWSAMADDLVAVGSELLKRVGADRFALGLGHSFGGTLSLAAAALGPALYERILLVDPVIFPPVMPEIRPDGHRGFQLAERARRRRDSWADRAEARAYLAARPLFAAWEPRALDLYVHEGLRDADGGRVELKCPREVESAIFSANPGMDIYELARGVEIPVRLLWAARGNFPRTLYEQLVARMPNADIEEADAAHLVVMEDPALVQDAVRRFVDGS